MDSATTSESHSRDTLDWPPVPSKLARAGKDLFVGLTKYWLWMELANQDIKLRYRGSMLGPLWLTISTIVMISTMGLLYAKLFHENVAGYLPFLAVGLVTWNLLASMMTEGCSVFVVAQGLIQTVPLPYSVHVYRLVYRNLLVFGHSFVVVPLVLIIFGIPVSWGILWAIPALLVLAVNGAWYTIFFGMLSARFRDVPPIVASFVNVIFFVTPIMWAPSALGNWERIGTLNPLFAGIDVVRAPILGQPVSANSWAVLLLTTVVGCLGTFAVFGRFRSRIPFWV
jgi:ABC-type polysaccharide/polyol phosphate export permease